MRIGLIEAGMPPETLVPHFGTYGAMIAALLGPDHVYSTFRAFESGLPTETSAYDALVISGSACGVYDGLPWIDTLSDFVRAAAGRTKLVGICFGHQLLAQAFGGTVRKAPQGWGIGLHRYDIVAPAAWIDDARPVSIAASHQDQVVVAPPSAIVHASSAFTPNAVLGYVGHPTISFQFHPEFTTGFARALLEARRSPTVPDDQRNAAIASLDAPADNDRVAGWITRFLAS